MSGAFLLTLLFLFDKNPRQAYKVAEFKFDCYGL